MEQEYFEALYPDTTRFNEITQIVNFVKDGGSCQLIGIPGSGRSSLLNTLVRNTNVRVKHFGAKQKEVHFVLANFSEIRNRSLFDVMKYLFLNLTESLRERKMPEENKAVGDIFREHLKFNDELILFQGFKEAIDYMCLEKKTTVVFLFDRFEEYIPMATSEFFTNLRILRSRARYKLSIVFSVYRPLESFLEPSLLSDYYEFVAGHIVYLPVSDFETTKTRVEHLEKLTGKKISKPMLEEINRLTGGTGRLVKLSLEAVLAHGEKHKDLTEFLLSQKTIKSALLEIWSILTIAEQVSLQDQKSDDPEVVSYLESVGLVKNKKITIPLLEAIIKRELVNVQKEDESIFYDQNTNSIKIGEEVLSDKLTASEFRLLRFLLQNKDRIVERDELIAIVWADNKSTAGITDQAIDQLIFRLRRKIEKDPNNPQYLETVKGRGFKLVA